VKRLFAIFVLIFLAIGCADQPEAPSANYYLYNGTHLLRQIQQIQQNETTLSGGYFLFGGAMSGASVESIKVTFAWKGNDSVYRFTTLPLSKVRISIDDGCVVPYVRFRWVRYPDGDEAIRYVVLGVNSKDWPEKIQVPLQ